MPKDLQEPPQSPTPTQAGALPPSSSPLLAGMDEPLFGDLETQAGLAALDRVIAAQRAAKAKKDR